MASALHIGDISKANIVLGTISLVISYYFSLAIYRIFFHPLKSFPGPLPCRISLIPRAYWAVRGDLIYHVTDLHAKYGPVVRLSPNELVFSDPQAWKDIYGHRAPGQEEFPKFDSFYRPVKSFPTSIITADRSEHGQVRRQLAHGFSERSMRGQEPIIGSYVDLLISQLRTNSKGGSKPVNMREWLNWATFDIIGDLGFGSSFGCLNDGNYHPWVHMITNTVKESAYLGVIYALGFKRLTQWISKSGAMKDRDAHRELVLQKLMQRIELGAERPDLIEGLIRDKENFHLPIPNLVTNASTLIIAGSETTATLLCGATFFLTMNPDVLYKLADEVRSSFKDDTEITLSSVARLSYMLACLNESLRCYPPVAGGLPRASPRGGATVLGKFVPEGTEVRVYQWAINHDPNFWADPYGFHPGRWETEEKELRFAGDQLDAMQPFSLGPRNCIGKNLAYAEMRLILAKIIYNFDMRIADDSRKWLERQKVYTLWDKPALNVYLTPVAR